MIRLLHHKHTWQLTRLNQYRHFSSFNENVSLFSHQDQLEMMNAIRSEMNVYKAIPPISFFQNHLNKPSFLFFMFFSWEAIHQGCLKPSNSPWRIKFRQFLSLWEEKMFLEWQIKDSPIHSNIAHRYALIKGCLASNLILSQYPSSNQTYNGITTQANSSPTNKLGSLSSHTNNLSPLFSATLPSSTSTSPLLSPSIPAQQINRYNTEEALYFDSHIIQELLSTDYRTRQYDEAFFHTIWQCVKEINLNVIAWSPFGRDLYSSLPYSLSDEWKHLGANLLLEYPIIYFPTRHIVLHLTDYDVRDYAENPFIEVQQKLLLLYWRRAIPTGHILTVCKKKILAEKNSKQYITQRILSKLLL